jgi:hypothetical protein
MRDDIKMYEEAFDRCKRECDAINEEIDTLISEGRSPTEPEVQSQRFLDLLRRQREAAQRLIELTEALQRAKWEPEH